MHGKEGASLARRPSPPRYVAARGEGRSTLDWEGAYLPYNNGLVRSTSDQSKLSHVPHNLRDGMVELLTNLLHSTGSF